MILNVSKNDLRDYFELLGIIVNISRHPFPLLSDWTDSLCLIFYQQDSSCCHRMSFPIDVRGGEKEKILNDKTTSMLRRSLDINTMNMDELKIGIR